MMPRPAGYSHTEETKAKIREARSRQMSEAAKLRAPASAETLAKRGASISRTVTGRPCCQET